MLSLPYSVSEQVLQLLADIANNPGSGGQPELAIFTHTQGDPAADLLAYFELGTAPIVGSPQPYADGYRCIDFLIPSVTGTAFGTGDAGWFALYNAAYQSVVSGEVTTTAVGTGDLLMDDIHIVQGTSVTIDLGHLVMVPTQS